MVYDRETAARNAEAARTNTPGTCQLWTRTQFGAPSAGDRDGDGDADAVDGWLSEPEWARHTDKHPPRGVPVAWAGGSKGYGHRAVSLGGGLVRSTDIRDGRYHKGTVGTATIDQVTRAMGLRYLGWSETITGRTIPLPPKPPTIHRAAAWNLRVGRKPAVVVREVKALLDGERLDVLAVQEAAGYLRALRADRQLMRDYRVVGYPKRGASARDSAVIVRRRGHKIKGRRLHKMGGIRWERQPGRKGLHRPRRMVSVLVDGIRYASPHAPPGPRGPRYPLRAKAGRRFNRRLATITGRWTKRSRAWVAGGDYNDQPTSVGSKATPTPAWAARQTGARITGTGIDYVLSHGVRITDYRRGDAQGSDHRPIIYTVTKER